MGTLQQLGEEGRAAGSDPAKQLSNLFTEVSRLPAGEYLLQHTPKTGPFCNLLGAAIKSGSSSYDLHTPYTTLDPGQTVSSSLPSLNIDPGVLTPWHEFERRVPCTFEPHGARDNGQRGGGRG